MLELTDDTFDNAVAADKISAIDFWADWCMPCKMFGPIFDEVSKKLDDKVGFYRVDVDECQRLAEKFQIKSIPTVLVLKNGQIAERLVGMVSADKLYDCISLHI